MSVRRGVELPGELDAADRFFARWGSIAVLIGRLLPVIRSFIAFPAGVARMPLRTFVVYSTAGALLWSILLAAAGVALGAHWLEIRKALQPFDTLIAGLAGKAAALGRPFTS